MMIVIWIAFIIAFAALVRTLFILAGWYKDPILRSFEAYQPEEMIFCPLLDFLFAIGACFLLGAIVLLNLAHLTVIILLFVLPLISLYPNLLQWAYDHPLIFFSLPLWYRELRARTNREERRKIAFMWLHLPRRLRLHYSIHQYAFAQWIDLVLMSIVR